VVAPHYVPAAPATPPQPEEKKPTNPEADSKDKEAAATIRVHAPLDVEVAFNGVKVARKQESQNFKTPALMVGQPYHYTITAKRAGAVETKVVNVQAGATVEVDLRDMPTASPR
jgi:uncharacterized protein (TIGR03000 family)